MKGTFRSLRGYNYRVWAIGGLLSNVGTWMQRTAQDWLVLTELTHHNATAVGIVMALQFGPQLLLLPWTGFAADHFDRRRLLMLTQGAMGLLAMGLGLLTVFEAVQLWQVYVFAFLLGCVAAFDAPARLTFVAELVGDDNLSNAVALNSASFSSARMVGPAAAGLLISAVGSGWAFLVNSVSFAAVLFSLMLLRADQLHASDRVAGARGSLAEGFRYVWRRPELKLVLFTLFVVGTFGLNFPIFISTMSVIVFQGGPSQYGLLTSAIAIGSVAGALFAASRLTPSLERLLAAAGLFGLGCALAALMPNVLLFGLMLVLVGVAAQTLTTSTNSFLQLSTTALMRGRVMAIFLAILLGSTPVGAPIAGWVADHLGPRWALGMGAASGIIAGLVGLFYLMRNRALHRRLDAERQRRAIEEQGETGPAEWPGAEPQRSAQEAG